MLHHASGEPYAAEAILHLAATPAETSLWWLMGLMQVPPPWRLSVHLTATDRAGQRRRFRWRHRRLWADLRRRERDGKLIPEEAYEEEREAAEIAAELRSAGASGIYDVSVYFAIRRDAGEQVELAELAAALSKDFERYSDARLYGGRFLVEDSWVSTLPLGVDRLGATRRFAQRNVGDCIPLLSTSASSPGGVPLGLAVPGSTLERVDLFDEEYRTHVALVTGASGSGKTVAVNALLARNLARGATGYIIDRSSSEDEGGSTRQAGHYEPLTDLIPGARITHFGAEQRDAILNPWDVADTARISAGKIEFLVALHTLLVGDVAGGDAHVRRPRAHAARARHPSRVRALHADRRAAARGAAAGGAATPGTRAGRGRARRRRQRRVRASPPGGATAPVRRRRPGRVAGRSPDDDRARRAAEPLRSRRAPGRPGGARDPHARRLHRPRGPAAPRAPARAPDRRDAGRGRDAPSSRSTRHGSR